MMRIAVIPERYGNTFSPCASIRLYPFLSRIRAEGRADVRFLLPSEVTGFHPEVIVWHRVSLKDAKSVAKMHATAHSIGARTVYDLDDNLLELENHAERDAYAPLVEAVRHSLQVADEVWCSTPALAGRVATEGRGCICTMPNAIDPELWQLQREPLNGTGRDPTLRLLYMGTRTHDEDFAFLDAVMTRLHARSPGAVELSLVGVRTRDTANPPWLRVLSPPPYIGASYPAFVHWLIRQAGFDMGVAPLMANAFNDCKSPIKVLDYAAIGLPTLASAVPAYLHSLEDGRNCFHVSNDVDAWTSRIEELMAAPGLREDVARGARELVAPALFSAGLEARWDRLVAGPRS